MITFSLMLFLSFPIHLPRPFLILILKLIPTSTIIPASPITPTSRFSPTSPTSPFYWPLRVLISSFSIQHKISHFRERDSPTKICRFTLLAFLSFCPSYLLILHSTYPSIWTSFDLYFAMILKIPIFYSF